MIIYLKLYNYLYNFLKCQNTVWYISILSLNFIFNILEFAGVKTLHYTVDLGDSSTNPREKCFCSTPDTCLSKNFFDLTKCLGVPIIGSLPHFYDTDGKYLQMVDGLHPNQVKSTSYANDYR